MTEHIATPTDGRRARLQSATRDVHRRLDQRIMAFGPFKDRTRYVAFLHTQHRLHRDAEALFADAGLNDLLPGLRERSRLSRVEQDLRDLGVEPGATALPAPVFVAGAPVALPAALGWLYTVEGSNIGAAFLLQAAAGLGLDAHFGARHLAPSPEGRAMHWRGFIAQLDAVPLSSAQEAELEAGAHSAFVTALAHVEQHLLAAA